LNLFQSTGLTLANSRIKVDDSGVLVEGMGRRIQTGNGGGGYQGSFVHVEGLGQNIEVNGNGSIRVGGMGQQTNIQVSNNSNVMIDVPGNSLRVSNEGVLINSNYSLSSNRKVQGLDGNTYVQAGDTMVSVDNRKVYVKVGSLPKGETSSIPSGTVAFSSGFLYAPISVDANQNGRNTVVIPGVTTVFSSGAQQNVAVPAGGVSIEQGPKGQEIITPGVHIRQDGQTQTINAGGVKVQTGKGGVSVSIPGLGNITVGGDDDDDEDDDESWMDEEDDDDDW